MNDLLPKIIDLEPISDSKLTFSETPFTREFNKLNDEEKLQILADIVRQTMIYRDLPNPLIDKKTLIGDDYTSSMVFIDYMKSLNIFENVYLVLVSNRKNIDIKEKFNCHFSVLVKGLNNKTYLVDTTPDIGYGCGEVNELYDRDLYNNYIILDNHMIQTIECIRYDMYCINQNIYIDEQINNYKIARKIFINDNFNGLLLKYYNWIYVKFLDTIFRTI